MAARHRRRGSAPASCDPIEPSNPLIADVGPSPPVRSSGRWLASAVSMSVAALPTVCALLALLSWLAGRRKLCAALGVGAALALQKLGALLLNGLKPRWHDGLALKTNAALFYLHHLSSKRAPDLAGLSVDDVLRHRREFGEMARMLYAGLASSVDVRIEDVALPAAECDAYKLAARSVAPPFARGVRPHVQFRVYRPVAGGGGGGGGAPLPALVFAHGGAFMLGSVASHDHVCSRLAAWSGAAVFSVEYRMYPEAPGAEAAVDVFGVLRHVRAHATALGVDPARLAVGGDSAGGTLAATVALLARDCGVPLALQLLVYPLTAASEGLLVSSSLLRNAAAPVLNLPNMAEMMALRGRGALVGLDDLGNHERHGHSPLRAAGGVGGVAPAIVLSAYYDPIFDHSEEYVRALRAAGVRVHYKCYYEMHGFWGGVTTAAGAASLRETAELLARLLGTAGGS